MPVLKNNQDEYNFYLNQLSLTTGQITDLERDFLYNELSLTTGNITDMWIQYLQANGATSDDYTLAWKEFLVNAGYTVDNLQDNIIQYFKDNS